MKFKRVTDECSESATGYRIARYCVVGGFKFVATKDGRALHYSELWKDDAGKAAEFGHCKRACEQHAEGAK